MYYETKMGRDDASKMRQLLEIIFFFKKVSFEAGVGTQYFWGTAKCHLCRISDLWHNSQTSLLAIMIYFYFLHCQKGTLIIDYFVGP